MARRGSPDGPAGSGRSLGRLERLPLRRIVLVALTVAIVLVVGGGIVKTLTLPPGERLDWRSGPTSASSGSRSGPSTRSSPSGYTLVYGILRMINFAHGEVFMAGAFVSYFFAAAHTKSGFLSRHPIAALGDPVPDGDDDLRGRRRAAGAGRVPAAAERPAPRPAHHRDRGVAVPAEHRSRGSSERRPAGTRGPDLLSGTLRDRQRQHRQGRRRGRRDRRRRDGRAAGLRRCGRRPASRCARSPRTGRSRA